MNPGLVQYRSEIDTLRAIAVLAVVLFHFDKSMLPGGFVGVDVFFVISGFLMGNILLRDFDENQFQFSVFFLRRLRRIYPALTLVILASSLFGWFILDFPALIKLSESALAALLSIANIYFLFSGGYFSENLSLAPLLHTWSLGVEEQFYFAFPLFLILVAKFNGERFASSIILVALISFGLALYASLFHPSFNFFGLPTRGWELLSGALGSCYVRKRGLAQNDKFWIFGLIIILCSIFGLKHDEAWPNGLAIFPVLGTLLCLTFKPTDGLVFRILTSRLFRVVGLGSYSIYLWHQPVFAYGRYWRGSEVLSWTNFIVLMIIVFVLSVASYFFVERPFRSVKKIGDRLFIKLILTASAVVLLVAGVGASGKIDREQWVAKELVRSAAVPFGNLDERAFAIRFLEGVVLNSSLSSPPTAAIVGSSRLMSLGSEMMAEPSVNLSVSSAQLEDLTVLSLSAIARANVSRIVLGIDPSMVLDNWPRVDQWRSYADLYQVLNFSDVERKDVQQLGQVELVIKDMVSHRKSIALRIYEKIPRLALVDSSTNHQLVTKRIESGELVYSESYANRRKLIPKDDIAKTAALLSTANGISEAKLTQLARLIELLQGKNVTVELVFSPYHPAMAAQFPLVQRRLDSLESRLRHFFGTRGVVLRGSYSSPRAKCKNSHFFDVEHFSKDCMVRVFNAKKDWD